MRRRPHFQQYLCSMPTQSVHDALSAQPLTSFLAQRTAATPSRPGLVTVRPTDTVEHASSRLASARVLSAPVVDARGSVLGTFAVADVVMALLERAYSDLTDPAAVAARPRLAVSELQTLAPVVMNAHVADVEALSGPANLWFKVCGLWGRVWGRRVVEQHRFAHAFNPPSQQHDKDATLLDVVLSGLRVTTPLRASHRVPVFGVAPGVATPDGPALTWTVVDVVSASDIIAFIAARKDAFKDTLAVRLDAVDLPSSPMATVDAGTPALAAFAAMRTAGAPSAALLNADGAIAGVLSFSDVRGLDARSLAALALSAAELAAATAAGVSPWDPASAPFGGRVPGAGEGDWAAVLAKAKPVTVGMDATVGEVVDAVSAARVHRAYVVNRDGHPIGVIELNDILRVLTAA